MGQQLQPWRSGDGQRLWLSMLIDTMEEVSRSDYSCEPSVLLAFRAQLARPAAPYGGSRFSLRN